MSIDKEVHEIARQALIRLMRDALELNDLQKIDKVVKNDVEYDIMDDFNAVADYIRYLLLKVNKYEPSDTQKADNSKIERQSH